MMALEMASIFTRLEKEKMRLVFLQLQVTLFYKSSYNKLNNRVGVNSDALPRQLFASRFFV